MTASLATRLASLAEVITRHDLPEPSVTLHPSGYCQLHVENLRDVRAWAVALGSHVTAMYVPASDGRSAFVSHATSGLISGQAVQVSFHDRDPERVAKLAPQPVAVTR